MNGKPAARGEEKVLRIRIVAQREDPLPKPPWMRVRAPSRGSNMMADVIGQSGLSTVCREAFCPNIGECFTSGTAAFLIMGDKCTRRCSFCNVSHGKPDPLNKDEPDSLAETVKSLGLSYAVITSVDRDDLRDGGAGHFAACIRALRREIPGIRIEILVPDFRKCSGLALDILSADPPDVFNHNMETVPSLYRAARPGADYQHSLSLLARYHEHNRAVPTKSGLMLGLGETDDEIETTLTDMLESGVSIVTMGQYLAPSGSHMRVARYVSPDDFDKWEAKALKLGFDKAFCGVFVRSSYHAGETFFQGRNESHGVGGTLTTSKADSSLVSS